MTTILSFDRRARAAAPVMDVPSQQLRTYTEVLADSLRSACKEDGDVMFSLFARVLDQHRMQPPARQPLSAAQAEMDTALDEILLMISLELHEGMKRYAVATG